MTGCSSDLLRCNVSPPEGAKALRDWLLCVALPLWAEHGVDWVNGGFHEKLESDLTPSFEPRRARLVARQIFVFSSGAALGWDGPAEEIMRHGLDFLLAHHVTPEGRVRASCTETGVPVDDRELLYDVAFVLLALARAARWLPTRTDLAPLARQIAWRILTKKARPGGGYLDEIDPDIPCANPHMHLLEAFIEWAIIPGANQLFWRNAAGGIASLALEKMILADTGALPEHYDQQWRPLADSCGLLIEPGHQFEWSWLLARWGLIASDQAALEAAKRLAQIGEDHGVDSIRNVAINEIDAEFRPRDLRAKLWPQTERVKAWRLQSVLASNKSDAIANSHRLNRAAAALESYLDGPIPGLWQEEMNALGAFSPQPVKASSGYHIACAIETLTATSEK